LTIDNILFVGTTVAAPPVSKLNTINKATQFTPPGDDTPPLPNTPESTTTYNIPHITHNEPVNKPTEDFRHTLRKTETTEAPQQGQDNIKLKEQNPAHHKAVQPDIVQGWLAQYRQTVQNGKEGLPTITDIKPKAGYVLAQLLTNLKADKSPPVTGRAAKSAEIKLLVTTDKGQLGLKTVLPDTSKGQSGLQTFLSNKSDGTFIADTQPLTATSRGKNSDKIPKSNSTVIPTKGPTNGENAKELIPDDLVNVYSTKTAADEQTAIADTSSVANGQKIPPLVTGGVGKKLTPETLVDNDTKTATTDEEAPTIGKSAIPGNEKTPPLNSNFPAVQTKLTESQSKPVGITPEKSTPVANKPSDSKAATPEILSESSGGGKESSRAGNKLSDNATVQDLNVTDVQVSTGQTKSRNSSTSNNSFNSDPEQILSHKNPQTPVTEQSTNSAEGAKSFNPPGQTSPSETYADVGKQILESIHKPLSQEGEDQQITVRLNPPELGKVFIKLQEQDDQIIGLLEVSKTQTRIEIQQALPQIIRSLQDSGIQIKRLDVVLSEEEQPEQEALRDQSLQNGWAQQQDSTNSYMGGNNPNTNGVDEWLTNNNSYQNISELQEAFTTDGSINMLV